MYDLLLDPDANKQNCKHKNIYETIWILDGYWKIINSGSDNEIRLTKSW